MKEKNLGIFTGFAACVMDVLSKKSESDIFNLAVGFKKAFYGWQTSSKLFYFGQPFLDHVESYVSDIEKLTPLEMNHQAVMIFHLIEMRETALDPTLKAILNYTDSLFTTDDQSKMILLLEKLVQYPSIDADSEKMADDLIRIVFIDPSERIGYGENRTILVEALNYWMSEKFGGKVRFPEIPGAEKASRRGFSPSTKPVSNKYDNTVAIPVPRKILRNKAHHKSPRPQVTDRNFFKDARDISDSLPHWKNKEHKTTTLKEEYTIGEYNLRRHFNKPTKGTTASTKRPTNKIATRTKNNDLYWNPNTGSVKVTSKKILPTDQGAKINDRRSKNDTAAFYAKYRSKYDAEVTTTSTIKSKKYTTKKTKQVSNVFDGRQTRSDRAVSDKATSKNTRRNDNNKQKIDTDPVKSSAENYKLKSDSDRKHWKDDSNDKNKDKIGAGNGEHYDFSDIYLSSDLDFLNDTRRKFDSSDSDGSFLGPHTTAGLHVRHLNDKRLARKILEYDSRKHDSLYSDNLSNVRRRSHHRHHHYRHPHHSHHKHRKKVSQRAKEKKRHQRKHKSIQHVVRDKLRQSQKMIGHLDHSFKKEKASHENKRHKHRGHKRKRHHRHKRRGRKRHKRRSDEGSYAGDRPGGRHRIDKKRFDVVKFTPKRYNFESPSRPRFTTTPEFSMTTPVNMETGIWTPPSSIMTPFNIYNTNPYPIIPLNKSGMVRSYSAMSSPEPKKMSWVERNKKETRQKILRRLISKRMEAKRAAEKRKKEVEEEKRHQELLKKGLKGAEKWKHSLTQQTTSKSGKVSIPFHPQNKQRHEQPSAESKDSGSTYKGNRRRMHGDDHQTNNNDTVLDDTVSEESNKSSDSSGTKGIEDVSSKEAHARKTGKEKHLHRFHISGNKREESSLKQRQMKHSDILSEEKKIHDMEAHIRKETSTILSSNAYKELKDKFKVRLADLSKSDKMQAFLQHKPMSSSSTSDEEDVLKSNLYKALGYPKEHGDSPQKIQDNKYVDKNDRPYGRLTN